MSKHQRLYKNSKKQDSHLQMAGLVITGLAMAVVGSWLTFGTHAATTPSISCTTLDASSIRINFSGVITPPSKNFTENGAFVSTLSSGQTFANRYGLTPNTQYRYDLREVSSSSKRASVTTIATATCVTSASPSPIPTGQYPFEIPANANIKVTLPQGHLAPITANSVTPESVGIQWTGSQYNVNRDWNEDVEGAHLLFTKGKIDWNGHTLIGVHQVLKPGMDAFANVGGGTGKRVFVENPSDVAVSDVFGKAKFNLDGFTILDPVGDGIRGLTDSTFRNGYMRIGVKPGGSSDKHYDGFQFHNGGNAPTGEDRANITIERVVIEMIGADIANVNAAVFFQSDNWGTVNDILVLDAAGVWFPIRFTGTKATTASRLQLLGERGQPNNSPGKLAPTAFVRYNGVSENTIDWNTVWVDVDGVSKKIRAD